jgi:hypothetical protein
MLTNMRLDVSVACHSDWHQKQSKLSIGTPQSAIMKYLMKDLMKSFIKPRHWRSMASIRCRNTGLRRRLWGVDWVIVTRSNRCRELRGAREKNGQERPRLPCPSILELIRNACSCFSWLSANHRKHPTSQGKCHAMSGANRASLTTLDFCEAESRCLVTLRHFLLDEENIAVVHTGTGNRPYYLATSP